MSVLNAQEYWKEIAALAESIIEEWQERDGEDISEIAHEVVDGHQWIIYYAFTDDVLYHCSNEDAWEDVYSPEDIGNLVIDKGMRDARTHQAFFAMEADVYEAVSNKAEELELDIY